MLVALGVISVLGLVGLVVGVINSGTPADAEPDAANRATWDPGVATERTPAGAGASSAASTKCPGPRSCSPSPSASPSPSRSQSGNPPPPPTTPRIENPLSTAGRPNGNTEGSVGDPVTADYARNGAAAGSFSGRVTVFNRTTQAQPWQVVIEYAAGIQVNEITSIRFGSATFQQTDRLVTLTGGSLAPLEIRTIEFDGTRTGPDEPDPAPRSCRVNGRAC